MNLAKQMIEDHTDLIYGVVQDQRDDQYRLSTDYGSFFADKAAGCLIEPRTGDLVLFCTNSGGNAYVLSVLKQAHPGRGNVIRLNGDLDIRLEDSQLSLHAEKGISVQTSDDLALGSKRFTLNTLKGLFFCKEMACAGESFSGHYMKAKVVAGYLESVFHKMVQHVNRSIRTVTEVEHLKARRLKIWVKELMQMKSASTSIRAREKFKVNSNKIYLG